MKNSLTAKKVKNTITYLYLLSFLPPNRIDDFKQYIAPIYKKPVHPADLKKKVPLEKALPDACFRIVAFQQAKREPDLELVNALLKTALKAEKDEKSLEAFKEQIDFLSDFPGRAKMENRLHRNKGCRYCTHPCRYGLFTLVSDPDFSRLQGFLAAEAQKPGTTQTPLLPVYLFTIEHLMNLSGSKNVFYERKQVANLAFCLLMLAMAKSRMAFPEAQIKLFQDANQKFIQQVTSGRITQNQEAY